MAAMAHMTAGRALVAVAVGEAGYGRQPHRQHRRDPRAHPTAGGLRGQAQQREPDLPDEHRRMQPMSPIRRFDHVGITVKDLDTVTAFFVGLGFETEGRTVLEGEFLDTVIGIPNSRTEIVMLRPPDGGTGVELASFIRPNHEPGSPEAMANELGLRSVVFDVDDLQAILDRLAADGYHLVGGVGQYEGIWRMASVRGPEGIIVSLAQRID
jgi:catechol 2,3-dioxygenase-like lactoylglutathione lyase family enzyme